jgi:hypothetical protein
VLPWVLTAAAAPPALGVVAASGQPVPDLGDAVFVRQAVSGFAGDGTLVWRATAEDADGEREVFVRSTRSGAIVLADGDPVPGGGAFGLSGVTPLPGAHRSWFVAAPVADTTLFVHDEAGVAAVVAAGEAFPGGVVEPFAPLAVSARDELVLRETSAANVVSLLHVAADGALTRPVTFGAPVPGIPGWVGDPLNRSAFLSDGALTFGVQDGAGRRAFAHGPPDAPALVDPQPWLPAGATCCVLLGVSPGGQAVYRGETGDGADLTIHLFAGPVPAPVEVLALPPGGIPVGNGQLGALAGPPVLGVTDGFAFVGDGAAMYVYTPAGGLVRAVAPGADGWTGTAPTPLAVSSDGRVVFEDTIGGAIGVYEWSASGVTPWFAPGDPVEHPLLGELPAITARFVGTSEDLDAGRAAVSVYVDDEDWVLLATLRDDGGGTGADDTATDGDGDDGKGCGCASTGSAGLAWLAVPHLLRRRARRT